MNISRKRSGPINDSSNSPAADAWPTLTCPPVTNG
ncbi:hypothetical protein MAJHIDBO_02264 [Propionibacterium freudenreichii subsp. shermanii]|nr:hypothetical protein MAJHIDBO_02264 [Propionibacterium freudenreichii subsp. shermanii]SPS10045.1 hypothetical protein MAJHIDBO_02264 [Propionibacterium freudenreichii subsp. shermanii]